MDPDLLHRATAAVRGAANRDECREAMLILVNEPILLTQLDHESLGGTIVDLAQVCQLFD